MDVVFVNGQFVNRGVAKVDIEDRGHQFGDGVYEVIRVYNGKMFTGNEHLVRLKESAEKVKLNLPYELDEIEHLLVELIEKNELSTGIIYMQITRGTAPRNHLFPGKEVPPNLTAYTREVARPEEPMNAGVRTILDEDIRWLRCDIKSLNLLGNLLSKQKASESGCFEAILHRGQTVTEGSQSNISIVKDNKVITHPADNLILNGITRQTVLKLCQQEQIPFEERAFSLEELLAADEVFSTGTTVEVMPIVEIDGKPVANGVPGQLTRRLQTLFKNEIEKQCEAI